MWLVNNILHQKLFGANYFLKDYLSSQGKLLWYDGEVSLLLLLEGFSFSPLWNSDISVLHSVYVSITMSDIWRLPLCFFGSGVFGFIFATGLDISKSRKRSSIVRQQLNWIFGVTFKGWSSSSRPRAQNETIERFIPQTTSYILQIDACYQAHWALRHIRKFLWKQWHYVNMGQYYCTLGVAWSSNVIEVLSSIKVLLYKV